MTQDFIYQYYNCIILRGKLIREDLWVRNGIILNPEKLFFYERKKADVRIDCGGLKIVPGFIDLQLNGGFSVDFSSNLNVEEGIDKVAKGLLSHGVTSFCPTIVTSPPSVYKKILQRITVKNGSKEGAGVLGVHLEGPFINKEKKGAHPESHIASLTSTEISALTEVYGRLDNARIITMAPELQNAIEVVNKASSQGIVVSLGHSMANLVQAEEGVKNGATLITHLFNAMLPFHHRDPGIVGLLTSKQIPKGRKVFYGMISDGIHTHPAALRIAHRANPDGIILVTDAIAAMGLPEGEHKLGQQSVTISGFRAHLTNSNTLAGSVATMPYCVRHFLKATGCPVEEALAAATLHPAQCLGITERKGTLDYGSDADFLFLDDSLNVVRTYIAGELVYSNEQ